MKRKVRVWVVLSIALGAYLCFAPAVEAATCYYEPYFLSSDLRAMDQYFVSRICEQSIVDKYWGTFGFRKKYWDDGFGYYDVCNWQKPLGRTMGALYLLENSYEPKAANLSERSGRTLGLSLFGYSV
jgi:hypothetical protein